VVRTWEATAENDGGSTQLAKAHRQVGQLCTKRNHKQAGIGPQPEPETGRKPKGK
jgi:hypothetical protein